MTIDDQIKDKKQQYDINREVAKISALSSGKIDNLINWISLSKDKNGKNVPHLEITEVVLVPCNTFNND